MDNEPYFFSTNLLENLVWFNIYILLCCNFYTIFFVNFTSNQFMTNCIAMTVFTLFYYEKIVSYVEKRGDIIIDDNGSICIKDTDKEASSVNKKSSKSRQLNAIRKLIT